MKLSFSDSVKNLALLVWVGHFQYELLGHAACIVTASTLSGSQSRPARED